MKRKVLKFLSLLLAVISTLFCFGSCDFDYEPSGNSSTSRPHYCLYTEKIATERYKKSEATCLKKATYYYSCECGEKSLYLTFEYGSKAEHNYENGECVWCNKKAPGSQASSTPSNSSVVSKPQDNSKTVYVTPTGKKFHYSKSCAGKNASATTQSKAEKSGLTGCKKCT